MATHPKPIEVTDHAIVRYIERVMGQNREALARMVLPENVEDLAKLCGNGTYPVADSHLVEIRDSAVVTVVKRRVKRHERARVVKAQRLAEGLPR